MLKPLALALAVIASPSLADEPDCLPRDKYMAALVGIYGEEVILRGIAGTELMAEFWVNPRTGTWTMTKTAANGITCQIASGSAMAFVPQGDPA